MSSERNKSNLEWTGQPDPKYKWTRYEWLFLPLSWFVLLGSIFWLVALKDAPVLYIFAVMLFAAGFYFVFLRNHFKKKKREKYSYELSKEELTIVLTKKKDVIVRQLPLINVRYVGYSIRKDGTGTIYFNFPNDYLDLLRLIFAHSGIGYFDENIYALYEIRNAEEFLELIKPLIPEEVIFEKI